MRMNLEEIVKKIQPVGSEWVEKAREHTLQLAIPPRALGRLHDISERICGIQETLQPEVFSKAFLVMAGDHGVASDGVSAFPQEVTGEMVKNFLRGGAGINVLARNVGAEVLVVDMGIIPDVDPGSSEYRNRFHIRKVGRGTANIARGPAMTRAQAEQSILHGFNIASELFSTGVRMLGTGDMGIGNTTPSAALGAVLTGKPVNEMVGRGTGIGDSAMDNKCEIVKRAIEINRPNAADGLDALAKVGGFEIGGIAGCVLAAAYHRRPAVIDGFISTAGALVAHSLCPAAVDYVFAGHCSEESGHRKMLAYLGLEPILDLGLRLGEGTGAALAMGVIEGAVRVFNEVLTFEQAGVTSSETASVPNAG
ncbi:MAG: nicotinate-nucleotide--dimethylbenzimidazole phosphoribosyltransferase [Deltaproteobacteria bacterium]|nr:nicotinate-nucleotide--dimethylbenzimidazole phosphoribosyltransferase [Deltaproteobacteria bacterium]